MTLRLAPPGPQQHQLVTDVVTRPPAYSNNGSAMLREQHQLATDVPGSGLRTTTGSQRCGKPWRNAGREARS